MGGAEHGPAGGPADGSDGADAAGARDAPDPAAGPGGDAGRPRWRRGSRAAVVALGVALVVQGLVQFALGDGSVRGPVDEPVPGTLSITAGIGGWPLVAAAVAFVLFAQPWRLLRRRG